jgi:hypothetical protein
MAGDVISIAPQVLVEFIHVVTDLRRFTQPLDMNAASQVAEQWWTSSDVVQAFPDAGAVRQFLTWMQQFSLGRKRQSQSTVGDPAADPESKTEGALRVLRHHW